jgi:hypothetical protein
MMHMVNGFHLRVPLDSHSIKAKLLTHHGKRRPKRRELFQRRVRPNVLVPIQKHFSYGVPYGDEALTKEPFCCSVSCSLMRAQSECI